MNSGRLLYQGIQAFKTGQVDEARRLLEQVVAQDEANETAWLGLSAVMENSTQRRICLENVLFLNPDNEVAKERLALLPERKGKTNSWLSRWLARKSDSHDAAGTRQIQQLQSIKQLAEKNGSGKEGQPSWQPVRTYFLLAGGIGLILLTALLVVFV